MTRDKFENLMKQTVVDYYNGHTERSEIDKNDVNKFLTVIDRKVSLDFYRIEIKLRRETKNIYIGLYNRKTKDIHFSVYTMSDYEKIPFVTEEKE